MAGREGIAASGALGAYLATVLPRVRRELRRRRSEAALIPDPRLRAAALSSLDEKASNVEAVAVLATLAPRRRRPTAVRAIAALQMRIDLLDSLEESGISSGGGGRYLERLERTWRGAVDALPAASQVQPALERAVERCAEGQRRTHAAAEDGEQLEHWGRSMGAPGYRWWELAAGASSSVAAHALIAAAADQRTDAADADAIDAAYFPSVGALTVLLDDLVDREADAAAGEPSYLDFYASAEEAAERIAAIGADAATAVAGLPDAARHGAILAGVAAFYLSRPEAETPFARPIRERLLAALGPGPKTLSAFVRLRRPR